MKYQMGAVCAAAMLLLTGCVRDGNTDLAERYPAYFRYCFGEEAICRFVEIQNDTQHLYRIAYTGKDGSEQSTTYLLAPYKQEEDGAYQSAKDYYDAELEAIVMAELAETLQRDFVAQVLKKHFDGIETDDGIHIGDEAQFSFVPVCTVWGDSVSGLNSKDPLGAQLCAEHTAPVTGWRIWDADWADYAADPQWYYTLTLTVSADADADAYLERLQAVYAEYRACTDQPQTCTFLLRQSETERADSVKLLWRKNVIVGEETDTETKKAENAAYSVWDDIAEKLRAYYAGTEKG